MNEARQGLICQANILHKVASKMALAQKSRLQVIHPFLRMGFKSVSYLFSQLVLIFPGYKLCCVEWQYKIRPIMQSKFS